jgi:hypothetical protein
MSATIVPEPITDTRLAQMAVDTIRTLSIDAVQGLVCCAPKKYFFIVALLAGRSGPAPYVPTAALCGPTTMPSHGAHTTRGGSGGNERYRGTKLR